MVPKGNPKKLSDLKSCASAKATVGVLTAAVEKGFATSAGVPAGSIKEFAQQQDGLDALTGKRIDAFALTDISLKWLAKINSSAAVEVLPSFVPVVGGVKQTSAGGAVFRPADGALRDAFNKQLATITSSQSTYLGLLGQYGFTAPNVPPASLKTADLCKG
jgi:polar amino acid transport system substrate-binding protein